MERCREQPATGIIILYFVDYISTMGCFLVFVRSLAT